MKTIIKLAIVVAIMAVLVLDGMSIYSGSRLAASVAKGAAAEAARVYQDTNGDQDAADQAAQKVANESGVKLDSVDYESKETRWFEVTVSVYPKTYVLGHIPYVKGWLMQKATSVSHF